MSDEAVIALLILVLVVGLLYAGQRIAADDRDATAERADEHVRRLGVKR